MNRFIIITDQQLVTEIKKNALNLGVTCEEFIRSKIGMAPREQDKEQEVKAMIAKASKDLNVSEDCVIESIIDGMKRLFGQFTDPETIPRTIVFAASMLLNENWIRLVENKFSFNTFPEPPATESLPILGTLITFVSLENCSNDYKESEIDDTVTIINVKFHHPAVNNFYFGCYKKINGEYWLFITEKRDGHQYVYKYELKTAGATQIEHMAKVITKLIVLQDFK